jgi:hypothetical protein
VDDFGDAARSLINVFGEEIWEKNRTLNDIVIDGDILEKLIEGYLNGIGKNTKINLVKLRFFLLRAAAIYFFQTGTRFLKDFISEIDVPYEDDNKRHFVYFRRQENEKFKDKNLRLAEVQYFALVRFLKKYKNNLKLDKLNMTLSSLPEPLGW